MPRVNDDTPAPVLLLVILPSVFFVVVLMGLLGEVELPGHEFTSYGRERGRGREGGREGERECIFIMNAKSTFLL